MAAPEQASFPMIELKPGQRVVFEAIDPTTGGTITGVTVSDIAIAARGQNVGSGSFTVGPFMLVPGPNA